MKRHIVYLLLIFSISSFGQESTKSNYFVFSNSYPFPLGNNFVNKSLYKGIDNFEIGYNYDIIDNLFVGLDLNCSFLHRGDNFPPFPSVSLEIINPAFCLNYNYKIGQFRLIPQLNFGYALYRFYREADNSFTSYYSTSNALTITPQVKLLYVMSEKISLGLDFAYNRSWLDKPKGLTEFNSYNQRLQYLYPGLSVEIKI